MNEARAERAALIALSLLYLAVACARLDLPPVLYDEAMYAWPPTHIYRGLAGLPLMTQQYVGAAGWYVLAPVFAVFGVGVAALRLPMILLALGAALLWTRAFKSAFPRVPAWAVLAPILMHSEFLYASRTGAHVEFSTTLFVLGLAAALLARWSERRRPADLYLTFLLLGFGVWVRMSLLWFAPPAALGAWLSARPGDREPARAARLAAGSLAAFVLGLAPLIAHNLLNDWGTVRLIAGTLVQPSDAAMAPNTSLWSNLAVRWGHLQEVAAGQTALGRDPRWILGWPFLAACAYAARTRAGRFNLLCIGALLAGTTLTVSARWYVHLYPALPAVLGGAGVGLALLLPRRAALAGALAVLLLAQAAGHLRHLTRYATWEDPFYSGTGTRAMAAWLVERGYDEPVTLDWGIRLPLYVYSGGLVRAEEPAEHHGWLEAHAARLRETRAVLLMHARPDPDSFERSYRARLEGRLELLATFARADGRPGYIAARLSR